MEKLSLRVGDLEVRSCDASFGSTQPHDRLAIVHCYDYEEGLGESQHAYVVAVWEPGREGYSLRFVGDRPLKVNRQTFWDLAEYGQRFLDKHFAAGGGEAGAPGRIET